jgi:branched-chain amino acid transport system ATP-binding protein
MLEVQAVTKNFGGIRALSDVTIHVEKGERIGLIGPNGSGKTTLLNIIGGAQRPDHGRITFEGRDVTRMPAHGRARMGIGRTFQVPRPLPSMSVVDNVIIPLVFTRRMSDRGRDAYDAALALLDNVGLSARARANPKELTQLELRKLGLARALAGNPKLVLLDETLAGLTSGEADEVLLLLRSLNDRGIAIIMVEHIMRAVMSFSQKIMVLDFGVKIAEGIPSEITSSPEVVKAYIGE